MNKLNKNNTLVSSNDNKNFTIDINGFEGPIDLLLMLARSQKVDLTQISISELSQQYIDYISNMVNLEIEIAADYLVMATWLAFLKSKLLIPNDNEEEVDADFLGELLSHRLKRLDAMRNSSKILFQKKIIGRDIFLRGMPEYANEITDTVYQNSLFNLIKTYISINKIDKPKQLSFIKLNIISIDAARKNIISLFSLLSKWITFDNILQHSNTNSVNNISKKASSFIALLQLAKEGKINLRQNKNFDDIFIKSD
ncbi:MAG: segregation and condensation protein A [Alphaproteobacteria bacterium]|jgi:segregation and condensation protein A|tara:strand:+ start:12964 stop:13728 length:765 start_codon:yes stop_codon:yes gene_type:complete